MLIKDGEALSEAARLANRMQNDSGPQLLSAWFAVYVSSRHEKRVASQLELRSIDNFLPLYRAVHQWRNRCRRTLDLPLFPNYIFVRIAPEKRWQVLRVPGVVAIVGCGREPVPVGESVVASLRAALTARSLEPHPYLAVGHRVRITAGPLTGVEGILVRKKENLRVVLSVDQIQQSAAVEVDGDEVEDIGPASGRTN